jgi:hypothetical protein
MKPSQLSSYLSHLVTAKLPISTMIWGPPGIGKSSIVAQVAQESAMQFIDLRLSQLAPTDLRGLPVPVPPGKDDATGTSTWYPPEFLPRQGNPVMTSPTGKSAASSEIHGAPAVKPRHHSGASPAPRGLHARSPWA